MDIPLSRPASEGQRRRATADSPFGRATDVQRYRTADDSPFGRTATAFQEHRTGPGGGSQRSTPGRHQRSVALAEYPGSTETRAPWARDEPEHDQAQYDEFQYDEPEYDDGTEADGPDGTPAQAPYRRRSTPLWRRRSVRVAAVALAGSALMVAAWPALGHLAARAPNSTAMNQADMLGLQAANALRGSAGSHSASRGATHEPKIIGMGVVAPGHHKNSRRAVALSSGYQNPLRAVSGLVPERIDEGVDFAGTGPIYAIGDAIVTNAGYNGGWPGGGWITYRLTDGPDAGLMVYVAEDVTATVRIGQRVSSSTQIAKMFNGGDGIETGWAQQTGASAESELPEAGSIAGLGPYPTRIGISFDGLLQSLGVPAAPNASQSPFGLLPARYPAG